MGFCSLLSDALANMDLTPQLVWHIEKRALFLASRGQGLLGGVDFH